MTTEIPELENKPAEAPESTPERVKPRRSGLVPASIALLLSFLALVGTAWLWWQGELQQGARADVVNADIVELQQANRDLAAQLQALRSELESLPKAAPAEALARLEQEMREGLENSRQSIEEQIALSRSLQSAIESMQARLIAAEATISAMATRHPDAAGELDTAEVDYLLRLAQERLQLFGDLRGADRALELADRQLAAMDNPVYLGVRQEIAQARSALAAVKMPDRFALGRELDSLQSLAATLSFPDEAAGAQNAGQATSSGAEATWWERLKKALSGLVTVRRSTPEESATLSLTEQDYLRQRLWLQVEAARLAMMRGDEEAFGRALQRVLDTLHSGFDPQSEAYARFSETAEGLAAQPLRPQLPDIGKPWSTLRLLRSGGTAAPMAAPAAPEESGAE